ncbi:MAG TPA: DUF488 family protein [Candidatus Limnocylindrales bacterium]|nr:DUF488 family protein [Candidatus Limnocylindrales bacterium]
MSIVVKRVYDPPSPDDGYRVLVDRLWPRGLSKGTAKLDLWLRDIAPSTELRTWYDHQVERWPEFQRRYAAELEGKGALLDLLADAEAHHGRVTLLFGARDREHNEATVLADVLADVLRSRPRHSHR